MTRGRVFVVCVFLFTALAAFTGKADAQTQPDPGQSPAAPSLGNQVGDLLFPDGIGAYPTDRYKLYYGNQDAKVGVPNVPGPVDDVARAVAGNPQIQTPVPTERSANGTFLSWATNGLHAAASITWQMMIWLMSFDFIRLFAPLADTASSLLDQAIIGPLQVREFVGLAIGVVLAIRVLSNHRLVSVAAELAVATMLLVTSWLVIAHPSGYFNTTANLASQAALLPFRAINPADPQGGMNSAADGMKRAYVEAPWQVTNFGHELTGACAEAGDQILREGPFGTNDDKPRTIMTKAGCQEEAKFNQEPTGSRLVMTMVLVAAALGAIAVIGACWWAFLRATIGLLFTFATGIRLLLGAAPIARHVAHKWIVDLFSDICQYVIPGWLLALMVLGDLALMNMAPGAAAGTTALPLLLRLVLMAGLNWTVFLKRKHIVNSAARFMTAKINTATARVVRADQANVKGSRSDLGHAEARDFMPGHKLVTLPVAAAAVGVGRQLATGGSHVRKVRDVAASAAGPAGSAVKATKAGAAMTADNVKQAGQATAEAGRAASEKTVDFGQRVAAAASARSTAARQQRDARTGRGTAPLGDVHGPRVEDVGPVHGPPKPVLADEVLRPGSEFDDRAAPVRPSPRPADEQSAA